MSLISFSGLASGIDSRAFIDATLAQNRALRIGPMETRISSLRETNSALSELKGLLTKLQSATSAMRPLNGGAIAKQATSSNESVLTAVASNNAPSGIYGLNVQTLASNATFSFDDRASSKDAKINSAINDGAPASDRTVTFQIGQGDSASSVNIEINSETTYESFVAKFNQQAEGATASLVNVGTSAEPSYAIVISSSEQGESKGSIELTSVGSEVLAAGSGAFNSSQLKQATNLQLNIDGIGTITRDSNTVSDLFQGVTFTAESVGNATISVGVDAEATKSSVRALVDALNEVFAFVKDNNTVERVESGDKVANIFGPLKDTRIDDNLITTLKSILSDSKVSGSAVNILADLGIETDKDTGGFRFNEEAFNTAISQSPNDVGEILGKLSDKLGAVDGPLASFVQFGGLIANGMSSNDSQIRALEGRIGDAEQSLARLEQSLVARFAALEGLIGKLQSSQQSLSSILSGLG